MSEFIPLIFLLLFVGFWRLFMRLLRRMTRMPRTLPVDPGPALRESGWGSAVVNGVTLQNCVKLSEHVLGWQLRCLWLFGGGRLWLPRDSLRIGELEAGQLLVAEQRTVLSDAHQIRLLGPLARFLSEETGADTVPPPLI